MREPTPWENDKAGELVRTKGTTDKTGDLLGILFTSDRYIGGAVNVELSVNGRVRRRERLRVCLLSIISWVA